MYNTVVHTYRIQYQHIKSAVHDIIALLNGGKGAVDPLSCSKPIDVVKEM